MEVYRRSSGLLLLLGFALLATTLQGVQGEAEPDGPSESECRPFIEKALKELEAGDATGSSETGEDSKEDIPTVEITDASDRQDGDGDDNESIEAGQQSAQAQEKVTETKTQPEVRPSLFQKITRRISQFFQKTPKNESKEATVEDKTSKDKEVDASVEKQDHSSAEEKDKSDETDEKRESKEDEKEDEEQDDLEVPPTDKESAEDEQDESTEHEQTIRQDESNEDEQQTENADHSESQEEPVESGEVQSEAQAESLPETTESVEETEEAQHEQAESVEEQAEDQSQEEEQQATKESLEDSTDNEKEEEDTKKTEVESEEELPESPEEKNTDQESQENESQPGKKSAEDDLEELAGDKSDSEEGKNETTEDKTESREGTDEEENDNKSNEKSRGKREVDSVQDNDDSKENVEEPKRDIKFDMKMEYSRKTHEDSDAEEDDNTSVEDGGSVPVEDLSVDFEIPTDLRDRDHIEHLLKLDSESSETEKIINRVNEITLKGLKKLYDNAIKPLETVYKYRDLSNRHFGDAEIFSKPLILFMGPWSGGKSSIINYLVDIEYNDTALRTGAEPSPAYFNILMHGEEPEILDGTELAAHFTFSGLQKFGQGLEERLRGVKIPSDLLEKVNIVEIPGILEVRKQVSRVFPFNDACQWFIDRADIIFLVYDPSKLDVGPETEAILDQLKGREHQTRIVLNKADQVKPEELMRVQGALIWNISPLMSSPQPPVMYTTSLWSRPFEPWAPVRLLQAQERAFLRDLRGAIDKRIENKIASARRFAVRVRNHAKMVDCYLTTYFNHKSVFGNRKQVADEIVEHPQDYHIYEGLSTLTNISRYDLPDPDVYRDFFKLNPLYEFQPLSATCTYFRGCPINRLDIAIAYDLPELVGNHKKLIENALTESTNSTTPAPGS